MCVKRYVVHKHENHMCITKVYVFDKSLSQVYNNKRDDLSQNLSIWFRRKCRQNIYIQIVSVYGK